MGWLPLRVPVTKKVGRTYLRPTTGTEMPLKERFQYAPVGAYVERSLLMRNSQFRDGQQPKLREINYINFSSR